MDKIKKILISIYFIIISVLLGLEIYARLNKYAFSVSRHLYWLLLVLWIYFVVYKKWNSKVSLKIAFVLFVIGAFFSTIYLFDAAEVVLRISFVGWLIGIIQAWIESLKNKGK